MVMATASNYLRHGRRTKLLPWQKQRKAIEARERVARADSRYFNYKLTCDYGKD